MPINWNPRQTDDLGTIIVALLLKLGEETTITGQDIEEIQDLHLGFSIMTDDMGLTWKVRVEDGT